MILTYRIQDYPFHALVQEILNVCGLDTLHLKEDPGGKFTRETDQSTQWHERFYKRKDVFCGLYKLFLRDVICPFFDRKPIVYQACPTFRIQYPDNLAVGEWHKDSDYGHPENETTFWVPLTRAEVTSTVQIEDEDSAAYSSAPPMTPGDVFVFNAARRRHGNLQNIEGYTRVSFDFRVVALAEFKPTGKKSVNSGLEFDIGSYYEVMRC